MADTLSIIIRISILYILGVSSQVALRKRLYAVWFLSLSVWLVIFRLSIIRAVASYTGLFSKMPQYNLDYIHEFLRSSTVTNISDLILLIACVLLLSTVSTHPFKYSNKKK